MYADRQPVTMCGVDYRRQGRIVQHRATAVQYHLDQVMTMRGGLVDRACTIRGSCQLAHRSRRSPGSPRRVSTNRGQECSSDLDQATRRRIDLPAPGDARHPAEVVHLNHGGIRECSGIDQTKVDMPVGNARHDRSGQPWHTRLLNSHPSERDRPQLAAALLEDRRSESMADPEIVNGKLHGYLPISVRTAYSSGKKVRSSAFCKKPTPDDPPVPVLKPMVRCTVRR